MMRFTMIAGIASALVVACGDGSELRAATVVVFKSLGSLQCTGGGTTLSAFEGQLMAAGIQVLAAMCGNDGMVRAAVCGAPDGAIAIFEVPASQQSSAEMLSFAPLSTAPAAVITPCR
jgi:hypothetical protein